MKWEGPQMVMKIWRSEARSWLVLVFVSPAVFLEEARTLPRDVLRPWDGTRPPGLLLSKSGCPAQEGPAPGPAPAAPAARQDWGIWAAALLPPRGPALPGPPAQRPFHPLAQGAVVRDTAGPTCT